MIRYKYPTLVQPPAPFVNVTLRNPQTAAELRDVPAQLDTAADRTLLPNDVVRALNLAQMRTLVIGVAGGGIQTMTSYPVEIALHHLPAHTLEIVAHPNEKWVLLGRDFLNAYRIVLDGPRLSLEIG